MPELIIKTLTPLEFLNEESLLKDILDKLITQQIYQKLCLMIQMYCLICRTWRLKDIL